MSHDTPRYHLTREFNFSVVRVDADDDVIEVLALSDNAGLAAAAFYAALSRYSRSRVQMRNVGRVMHTVETGALAGPRA